ncbi:hypothetical protein CH254_24065 [Rhodococcus sp. 06-412-2C]|uniref:NAD(P)-dependent alcohol dehydrogenase n=1 Tax=unclassified Rhodococcus (in: high G+C Gram-positive bacteria) TaxID=192944 RepID=UPI000B9B758F|nr:MULTISPECIES: NAD(P)-dependent alcohol dehydrogenase [unclassified Rhodococcus (in: high G+C Gram-positive bacteria)]OZC83963.1 hypothetical protein CH254_24065 [Rhodococcus sp. 06-412-2C]OZC94151.1 hypothetical protein CH279_22150 [Rhodococcus sp. 06-412-2B]
MISTKAAVVNGPGDAFTIEDVELDEPRSGEVLVKVLATGVCHTDLIMQNAVAGPSVLGHEGSGTVIKVGDDVTGFAVGDKVVMSFASCGICRSCLRGSPAQCVQFVGLNMAGVRPDGTVSLHGHDNRSIRGNFFGQSSFAEYALTSPRNLVKVPDDTPDELLRILGPLGCAVQTGAGAVINSLDIKAGSSIVIFGAGAVGLSALLGAVVAGASQIVVCDINIGRLELASELGATDVVDARDRDVVNTIIELTEGGSDYSVESSGNMQAVSNSVAVLAAGGVAALVGLGRPGAQATFDHSVLVSGRSAIGVVEGDAIPQVFIPELISLHRQGKFPFDALIKLYPFDQIQQAADDSLSGSTIKGVVVFE